jgi:hypothetical protein
MAGYKRVQQALESGQEPSLICATCPWDRHCVLPPQMMASEIEEANRKAREEDDRRARAASLQGKKAEFPVGAIMTAAIFAGRDVQAECCPVFALRLRTSAGKTIADGLKSLMRGWDDNDVGDGSIAQEETT